MRRTVLIALALFAALALPAGAQAAKPKPKKPKLTPQQIAYQRADASYKALQKYYYVPNAGLYKGTPYARIWPFSQATAATVALASLPRYGTRYTADVAARLSGLNAYWDTSKQPPGYVGGVLPPYGRGGTIGYDDNEWIGLEMIRRYARDPSNTALLSRAQDIFVLAASGWDNDPTHPCPGGIPFSQDPSNVDRNTVSNAPAVELSLRLYQITHDQTYLGWAQRFYDWVRGCMLGSAGLFEDHITYDGTIDSTIWAYNQGTMIGADVLFWQVTGDASYLRRARRAGATSLAYFTPNRMRLQPPYFVAIYFDNLSLLNKVRPDSSITKAMQQYADWAWARRRNKSTGAFSFGTDGGAVLEQSAAVRIYAILAGAAAIG